jgi:hypothetical protein
MAKDADGNYYYDAGTVNEQFDNVAVTEDADGNLSMTVGGNEMRVHEFAHIFGAQRGRFEEQELGDGEVALYVSNGDGAGNAGDLVAATGSSTDDDTKVSETVIVASP